MDFTTTAMARPFIVDRTFKSFSKNLQGIDLQNCRLFINIDPLPSNIKRKDVIVVARKYFKEVYYNLPKKANFTAAVNWIWLNSSSEFIFHLEDDFEMIRLVDPKEIINILESEPDLALMRLPIFR